MQEAAFRAAGIPARYEAWDVAPEDLPALPARLRAEGIAGGNVTVPHKEAFLRLAARASEAARRVGAANAFRVEPDGAIVAENTDVAGFREALVSFLGERRGLLVTVFGAGGAARAVVFALAEGPSPVAREIRVLHHRTRAKAEALAALAGGVPFSAFGPEDRRAAFAGCDLVVQATPVGLSPDDPPAVTPGEVPEEAALFDLVYPPAGYAGTTPTVAAFRAAGRSAEDGSEMLVRQGAAAFSFWTGRAAPLSVMREAFRS